MVKEYVLDTEDEKIINELDNLYGVAQNKEILKNIILYSKLRQQEEIDFGNYNMIVRNDSSYNLLNDLLKVYSKILLKYNIIKNDEIYYLHNLQEELEDYINNNFSNIRESILVINEDKLNINSSIEKDKLIKLVKSNNDKIFIFEDTDFREGELDAELDGLIGFRMTIKRISTEDKVVYCKKIFNKNNIKYEKENLNVLADQPFWQLKNIVMQLLIECKSAGITKINKKMIDKKIDNKKLLDTKNDNKLNKSNKNAKKELNNLIGLR